MTEFQPIPEPAGALDPPRRFPPTAVGAATPEPEPEPVPASARSTRRRRSRPSRLQTALLLAIGLPVVGLLRGARALRELVGRR